MDFTTTLFTLGAMLSLVALIGAAFSFLLASDHNAPSFARIRRVIAIGTIIILVGIVAIQNTAAPQTSVFTLIPGIPSPHSTLRTCHVTAAELPSVANAGHATPAAIHTSVAGRTPSIRGSTALSDLFTNAATALDTAYHTTARVAGTSSQDGLTAPEHGDVDIGLSDIFVQEIPDQEVASKALVDYPVGVVVFALTVSPDLKDVVQNVTTDQLIDIYSGKITNWRRLGGPDEPITPGGREVGSGTQVSFQKYALLSTPKETNVEIAGTTFVVPDLLSKKYGAIGYAASTVFTGDATGGAYPICLNGYGATVANVNAGRYPYWNDEHAYITHAPSTAPTNVVNLFLRCVCGKDFQNKDLKGFGFLKIGDLAQAAVQTQASYPKPQPCVGS